MPEYLQLDSGEASLVLELRGDAPPVWRHLGARVEAGALPGVGETRGAATFSLETDVPLSTAPPSGLGWFGAPLLEFRHAEGSQGLFVATYCDAHQQDDRITLTLRDQVSSLELRQSIEKLPGGAFRFENTIRNGGNAAITLDSLASVLLPLPADSAQIISWRGRYNAELTECCEEMPQHSWLREERRGISGHGGPPGAYVLAAGATHHTGLTYALQLAWSGNSKLAIERDDEGFWTLLAEASSQTGECVLQPGESFTAPPAILAISAHGRNGAMAQHHAAVRDMVSWPGGTMSSRPVHLNSWEACYFDHGEGRIGALADQAASVGAERFVLDDGWFSGRANVYAGLGDWTADSVKYPRGLGPLAAKITGLGMEFGLWVEPEMVNPDSDLYRAHPDWTLATEGRDRPTGRDQLVLDMRRDDVRDYLFGALDRLLTDHPITYLKWDHNRAHAPGGGAAQTRGTYTLMKRLRAAYPAVEIEGCGAGGGRSDAGMAPYVHRFWTSDCIDAVARIGMQRGFLAFLPPEMMGSHVGASPSHATGRSQEMSYRAAIACMGHLGVELDPASLSDAENSELAHWIAFYKDWRHLLHGTTVHLGEGADGLLWQAHGKGGEWLLFAVRSTPAQDRRPQPLRLPFAAEKTSWDVRLLALAQGDASHQPAPPELFARMLTEAAPFAGSWLAEAGLPMPPQLAESVAIFHLCAA